MENTVSIAESALWNTIASIGSRVWYAILFVVCFGPLNVFFAQSHSSSPSAGEAGPIPSIADQSSFGKNGFIEYVVGNLPIVISVPHGGYLKPPTIPDRVLGTAGHQDTKTEELAREIIEQFRRQTGRVPHVVINRLHREKLDANRELFDAAQDDPIATEAWNEFHNFIDTAEQRIQQEFGKGLYVDLHGHRHTRQIIELGYLLVSNQLKLSDGELDSTVQPATTSLGVMANGGAARLSQMVRGPRSLGASLEREGFVTVPSPAHPDPAKDPYFSGGYNLEQHSSFSGKMMFGVQVETPTEVRGDASQRLKFAQAFVLSALGFLDEIGIRISN